MPLPRRQTIPVKTAKPSASNGDQRFANFETDPKFRLPSKKHKKTKLDSRFSRLQNDPDFHNKASVDKYGRKISNKASKQAIESHYDIDDEDEDEDENDESTPGATSKRDKRVLKELQKVAKQGFDPIRDGGLESSSDESSSDEEEELEVGELTELAGGANAVPTGDISSRLAAVNMDWDNVRAADIMAVAASFVPVEGRILDVTIYPSDFGRERMQREEMEGPPREIFASTTDKHEGNTIPVEVSPEPSDSEDDAQLEADMPEDGNGEDYNSTALRNYQLDRLRYYYAVITCSSASVAKAIYDNLDGQEYRTSANFFDLRFVPDGTTFDQDAHDKCSKLPDDYKPNEFTTDALTHSKVKLTWDADDTQRKEVQKRAFSRKEINENELQAYLGTDSSSSEDEAETAKQDRAASLRKALGLETGRNDKSAKKGNATSKRDRDFPKPEGEMEITFTGGLMNGAGEGNVFEGEIPIHETTAEKYVRKEKERKAKRKERAQAKKEGRDPTATAGDVADTKADSDDEAGFDDPFFASDPEEATKALKSNQKAKRASKRAEKEEQEKANAAERANLDLLMADEDGSRMRHFDMNEIMKAEKAKKKKSKKGKKDLPPADEGFQIDTLDPRFAKLYENHEFAIDPTNPKFKETTGMKALLEEGRKKRKHNNADDDFDHGQDSKKTKKKDRGTAEDDAIKLAARVKAKSKHK